MEIEKRVLLVDDDPDILHLLERWLVSEGYEVRCATCGADALRILLDETIPIMVTDWEMPGMTGPELCRTIRDHEGIGFIYTVFLTSFGDEDRLVRAFEAGADDFFTKPCNRRELLARIRAGERIVKLERDLARQRRELYKYNVEMELANRKLNSVNDKLTEMATTDELTGLVNRRAAMERLGQCWAGLQRNGTPLACILLDIDHFKSFNDTYGHAVGDLVLKETARCLRENARATDVVCRVGGEEFLILCPDANTEMAVVGAERLRRAIEARRLHHDGVDLRVTVSIGVAEPTLEMRLPDELLNAADTALYQSKRTGRNRVTVAQAPSEELTAAPTSTPSAEATAAASTPSFVAPSDAGHAAVDSAESGAAGARPAGATATVLLVDDDPTARTLYRRALGDGSYRLLEAEDGIAALGLLARETVDVVVLDARMPRLDGIRCARRIRADERTRGIPVLMISADDSQQATVAALDAGADECLHKPVSQQEFAMRVRNLAMLRRSHAELIRTNELLGEQTRMLTLLLDYSRLTTASDELDDVLRHTLTTAAELTCSARVAVLLPDASGEALAVAQAIGVDESCCHALLPRAQSLVGSVFQSRRLVLVDSIEHPLVRTVDAEGVLLPAPPFLVAPLATPEHVVGVLTISGRQQATAFNPHEVEFVDLLSNVAAAAIDDILIRRSRDQARESIVVALSKLAEHRDDDTGRHLLRVTRLSMELARALANDPHFAHAVDAPFLRKLERAVALHDIGKVGVPDAILRKPGALTPEEKAAMQTHTIIGREVIRAVAECAPDTDFLKMAEEIAYCHHEKFDGSGYPRGIVGADIPVSARVVALADVYDAITSRRVYRAAMPHDRAAAIILEGSGSHFDPAVVEAFVACEREFVRLAAELADDPQQGEVRSRAVEARPKPAPSEPMAAAGSTA